MPLTRRSVPLLATAALLLWPVDAWAGDPTLSPTPPPGLRQAKPKPSHRHHTIKASKQPGGSLPETGIDLALEGAAAAALIAGGTVLRAPRYFGRR